MTETPAPSGADEPPANEGQGQAPQEELQRRLARKGVRAVMAEALQRWGGGVSEQVREQVSGAARFDRFTERAKKVLVLAEEEARSMNHNYIGTEHLLLGLCAEGGGIAAKVLDMMDVGLDQVRRGVTFVVGRGDKPLEPGHSISLTPRAKRAIGLAVEEARRLNHNFIGTEHILLGLVREGEGVAASVLESMGANLEQVRTNIIRTVSASTTRDNVVSCRVGAEDLAAIDLLVEAGIRSTRSDAAQWLIHAGITANQSLFEQVKGTVDEIRRLRDQARETAQRLAEDRQPPSETGSPES
jgi:ATP-dependent Clp protease ATP-binding subunit ClpA